MNREQLDEITARYLIATFDEIEERMALRWDLEDKEPGAADLEDRCNATTAALMRNDYSQVIEAARAFAPQASEVDLAKLARRLLEVNLGAHKAEIAALHGEPLIRPHTAVAAPQTIAAPPKETPRFSEVAKIYGNERVSAERWSPKTAFQNRAIYGLLAQLLGDPQLGTITKAQVRKLGQDIVNLPANMTKRFPGVAPSDVLKQLEGTSTKRLEARSVNKYRQLLRSLFKWALSNDLITSNPATVLEDVKEGRARDDRKPFTDEDLRAYFGTLPQSPGATPFLFWIPRILAYSGMRLGEAAQLQREDVKEEQGVWIFDVNDEVEGKRLKTSSSKRKVPIHPRLVELGFLAFVQLCPSGFLWPERMRTTPGAARGDVDRLSQLLGRRLRSAGVKDPKKTGAHSFRHTVIARLKNASVHDYQIADLVGHDDDSMTTGRYGERTGTVRMLEIVSLLQLPI